MHCQMPIIAPRLMANPLKDAAKVESIDYSAKFDKLYTEWIISGNFIMMGKSRLI